MALSVKLPLVTKFTRMKIENILRIISEEARTG